MALSDRRNHLEANGIRFVEKDADRSRSSREGGTACGITKGRTPCSEAWSLYQWGVSWSSGLTKLLHAELDYQASGARKRTKTFAVPINHV